jgi:hypothetical protein
VSQEVLVYPWVSEGGPGGSPERGLLRREGRQVWLYAPLPDGASPTGAERAWCAPGRPGWAPFFGLVLEPGVVARQWRYCVDAPDTWWWDTPPP